MKNFKICACVCILATADEYQKQLKAFMNIVAIVMILLLARAQIHQLLLLGILIL